MIKGLALRGGDGAARADLAQKIAHELERRRFAVALWLEEAPESALPRAGETLTTLIKGNQEQGQITWQKQMELEDFLPHLHVDYLILDHDRSNLPHLLLPAEEANRLTLAFIGPARETIEQPRPYFVPEKDFAGLVDYIVRETPSLPPFPDGNPCCGKCGYKDCGQFIGAVLAGEKSGADCALRDNSLMVRINGQSIPLVSFVQRVVKDTNLALLGTLNGFEKNSLFEIVIDERK